MSKRRRSKLQPEVTDDAATENADESLLDLLPPSSDDAEATDPVAEPAPVKPAAPSVVAGKDALDPRQQRAGTMPVTANVWAGTTGQDKLAAAGFVAWARINGHTRLKPEKWAALFDTYQTQIVRS